MHRKNIIIETISVKLVTNNKLDQLTINNIQFSVVVTRSKLHHKGEFHF